MAGSQSSPVLSPSRYEAIVPWPNIGKVESKNSPTPNDPTTFLPMVVIFMVEVALLFCLNNGGVSYTDLPRYDQSASPAFATPTLHVRSAAPSSMWWFRSGVP